MTQAEIAHKLGVSQSSIANKLRLLALSHEEQRTILTYGLTERHARSVLRLKRPEERALALRKIYEERLNVAQAEEMIEGLMAEGQREKQANRANTSPESGREPTQSVLGNSRSATSVTIISPQTPPRGCIPRKFAIPDLTPLYNSIERTLSIFRKTGATASCMREESSDGVRIVIEVPKTI